MDSYAGEGSWWGGNLMGVRRSPVRLVVPNRLVYSAHVYGPAEYQQAWFNASTSTATLRSLWRRQWAYVSESGIAPVWIGEFGTPNSDEDVRSTQPGSEGQWFSELVRFLHEEPNLQWTYWGINGEDRYGLLDAHYGPEPANRLKAETLASILPSHLSELTRSAAASSLAHDVQVPVATMPAASQGTAIVSSGSEPTAVADPSAAAAREEIERSLFSAAGPAQAPPASEGLPSQSRQREHVSAAAVGVAQRKGVATQGSLVHAAEAADVQQAVADAMRTAGAH